MVASSLTNNHSKALTAILVLMLAPITPAYCGPRTSKARWVPPLAMQ